MICRQCNQKPVRKIVDKSKKSVRVEVPANVSGGTVGFNYCFPSDYAKDMTCLECFHYNESQKEFKAAKDVDDRWSNIFKGDFA